MMRQNMHFHIQRTQSLIITIFISHIVVHFIYTNYIYKANKYNCCLCLWRAHAICGRDANNVATTLKLPFDIHKFGYRRPPRPHRVIWGWAIAHIQKKRKRQNYLTRIFSSGFDVRVAHAPRLTDWHTTVYGRAPAADSVQSEQKYCEGISKGETFHWVWENAAGYIFKWIFFQLCRIFQYYMVLYTRRGKQNRCDNFKIHFSYV